MFMCCQSPKSNKRVVFLVRKLDQGGAQRQILATAIGLKSNGWDVHVVVFYSGGVFEGELVSGGVPLYFPGKRGRWDVVGFLIRLIACLRNLQPTVIYAFMDMPNIISAALKPLLRPARIVWGLRASSMDFSYYGWLPRLINKIEIYFSRFSDFIVANSYAGRVHAINSGFKERKFFVVPNGIDVDRFRPDRSMRQIVRSEFGIKDDLLLVGLVGRLDPMKDHLSFLHAARIVAQKRDNVYFICVGGGSSPGYIKMLAEHQFSADLVNRLIWTGARNDMPRIFNALDLLVSSSAFGEGFSNTVAEAMACAVPCVVTDVGDSALIVGNTGLVVSSRDSHGMAEALLRLIDSPDESRKLMGAAAQRRIAEEFSLEKLIKRTEVVLETIC